MRETELTQFYIEQLVGLLSTPLGLAGLLALLALVAGLVTVPALRWFCLTALIYIATVPLTEGPNIRYAALAFPLDQIRSIGRPLIYLFLGLLLIPFVLSQRGWRQRIIGVPLALFLAFELLISFRLIAFGNTVRGTMSVVSYGLLVTTLCVGVGRWLQTLEDAYKLIWSLCIAGGLVAVATIYQLGVNRSLIIANNRLIGVTGNPQFFGIIIAYTLPFACHLLTRPARGRWIKPLLVTLVAVMIVMLIWTGSRMGVLATGLGLLVLFHRQLGRFAVAGAVVAVAVYFIMPYFEGSSAIASRLIWTTNTRAGVWAYMIENFKQQPLFGVSREMYETNESSYLAMLAQFGITGSLPCLIAVIVGVAQLTRLFRLRHRLGSESGLVDLALSVWTAIFVTSVFEGLLMGVITYPVMMIYVMSAFTTFLIDAAEQAVPVEPYSIETPDYYAPTAA